MRRAAPTSRPRSQPAGGGSERAGVASSSSAPASSRGPAPQALGSRPTPRRCRAGGRRRGAACRGHRSKTGQLLARGRRQLEVELLPGDDGQAAAAEDGAVGGLTCGSACSFDTSIDPGCSTLLAQGVGGFGCCGVNGPGPSVALDEYAAELSAPTRGRRRRATYSLGPADSSCSTSLSRSSFSSSPRDRVELALAVLDQGLALADEAERLAQLRLAGVEAGDDLVEARDRGLVALRGRSRSRRRRRASVRCSSHPSSRSPRRRHHRRRSGH